MNAIYSVFLLVVSVLAVQAEVTAVRDARCPRVDDPEKTIHLAHPTDCNRFLVCSAGRAYEMRCPEGLEYDLEQLSCDYDYNVRCSVEGRQQMAKNQIIGKDESMGQATFDRPSWANREETYMAVPEVPKQYKPAVSVVDARCPRTDDPRKPIHLPRTGNCAKFMKCFGGRAYEMDCPAGLEFDVKNGRCEYPALAGCGRM
ncbi:peritrophin-1-like [Anopheles aquasalis]|uniref:peritrophin-1-like n=1 Tax=Anopheles aquasalis TaxID=42839 RepID=UPI00215B3E5D|nr:peritrophin-1-like [Anopheles aquasalis]